MPDVWTVWRSRAALAVLAGGLLAPSAARAQQSWDLGAAPVSLLGPAPGAQAGVVASLGDLDGDGFDDLGIGAPLDGAAAFLAGRAFLFIGSRPQDRNGSLEQADVIVSGIGSGDLMGWAMAGVGDVDGDGHEDLAIGALLRREGDGSGVVALLLGPSSDWPAAMSLSQADVLIEAEHLGAAFGALTVGAGDADGDGIDDLWLAAPHTSLSPGDSLSTEMDELKIGRVFLLAGTTEWAPRLRVAEESELWISGVDSGAMLGSSLAVADLDDDGWLDLCAGAPGSVLSSVLDVAGAVHCLFDPGHLTAGEHLATEADLSVQGMAADMALGTALAAADVDGDGSDDLIIGAPGDSAGAHEAGMVVVFLGGAGFPLGIAQPTAADVMIRGTELDGHLGTALAAVGDADGDGIDDLLLGAPGLSREAAGAGGVFLCPGRGGGEPWPTVDVELPVLMTGELAGDRIGAELAGLGPQGDGYPAFLVGGRLADHGGVDAGKVYLAHAGLATDDDGDGYAEIDGDCRDDDPGVHPGTDAGSTVDDDCDGHAEDDGDCDDTMAEVFPGAPELVDGVDNDCDGAVDESDGPVSDGDGDGWSPGDGDCDDAAAAVYPGAAETCNGIDDDCNGLVDEDEACGGVALAGCGACAVESGATSARGLGSLLLLLLASIVRRRTFGPEAGAGYSGPSARPPR